MRISKWNRFTGRDISVIVLQKLHPGTALVKSSRTLTAQRVPRGAGGPLPPDTDCMAARA